MGILSYRSIRMSALILIAAFGVTLVSPAAFARGGYPGSFHSGRGGYSVHVHGDDFFPAFLAGVLFLGVTSAIIDSATAPSSRYEAVERTPAVSGYAAGSIVVTAQLLNVRSGPSMDSPAVQQVPNGTILSVQGNSPGWYYVRISQNLYGWVMSQFTAPVGYQAAG